MGRDRRSGFASPFDKMLEETRKEFEKLAGGTGPRRSGERPPEPPREPEPAGLTAPIAPPNPPAPLPRAPAASDPAPARPSAAAPRQASGKLSPETENFLNQRLGNGWSFEVTERRREGDEVVARCKLSLADRNLSKTQYGRARVASAGEAGGTGALEGSADGLAFSIETNGFPLGGVAQSEDEAFQQAIESAPAKCAELLSKTLGKATGG